MLSNLKTLHGNEVVRKRCSDGKIIKNGVNIWRQWMVTVQALTPT